MDLIFQVPTIQEADEIYAFAETLLNEQIKDPTERTFLSWKVPWRREALNHYLPLGWSFTARTANGELHGFFLGQALLFFRGLTQNLWIETIQAKNEQVRTELIEVATKIAREKHLQRVLFSQDALGSMHLPKGQIIQDQIIEVATTKTT